MSFWPQIYSAVLWFCFSPPCGVYVLGVGLVHEHRQRIAARTCEALPTIEAGYKREFDEIMYISELAFSLV